MNIEEAIIYTVLLHEACHLTAAKLLRVQVRKMNVNLEKRQMNITVEGSNLKLFFIEIFPYFFDLVLGMKMFHGYFRVLWLKAWVHNKRGFAKSLVCELKD